MGCLVMLYTSHHSLYPIRWEMTRERERDEIGCICEPPTPISSPSTREQWKKKRKYLSFKHLELKFYTTHIYSLDMATHTHTRTHMNDKRSYACGFLSFVSRSFRDFSIHVLYVIVSVCVCLTLVFVFFSLYPRRRLFCICHF